MNIEKHKGKKNSGGRVPLFIKRNSRLFKNPRILIDPKNKRSHQQMMEDSTHSNCQFLKKKENLLFSRKGSRRIRN